MIHPLVIELQEGRIEAQLELPDKGERLVTFAYQLLDLSGVAAEMGQRAALKVNKPATCAKGCAACCRQLVPLSPPEAGMVFEFVMTMPEPRRATLIKRFDQAVERLRAVGLVDALARLKDPGLEAGQERAIARAYFQQQIPCPFLEDECCGIYPVRPSVCREYLVASPPQNCADPFDQRIERLPLSMRMSEALTHIWAARVKQPPELVPFTLSLEWTRRNPSIRTLTVKPDALVKTFQRQIRVIADRIGRNGL